MSGYDARKALASALGDRIVVNSEEHAVATELTLARVYRLLKLDRAEDAKAAIDALYEWRSERATWPKSGEAGERSDTQKDLGGSS